MLNYDDHDDSSARLRRIEDIIRIINQLAAASNNGVSITSLLDEYQFSRRTLERTINVIKSLYPEQFKEIDLGRKRKAFYLKSLYRQGPINFSSQEIASLNTASGLLKGHEHIAKDLETIYHRLSALAKSKDRHDLEDMAETVVASMMAGPALKVESLLIAEIQKAILSRKKIRINYLTRGSRHIDWYIVKPYGILYSSKKSYLIAFRDEDNDYRYFLLPNIKEMEIMPEDFDRDEKFSLEEYAQRSFGAFQEKPHNIVWKVSPACAAEAREYVFHPTQQFEENSDGSLTVSFTAGGLLEMCFHLVTWQGEIEIIEPSELKTAMKDLIKNMERSVGKD